MQNLPLKVSKVRVHNLKDVSLTLEPEQLVVFTGVSGSGKSSLAFDTIYVEGQRRYVESLSTFARRYMGDLSKPDAEHISGISPTISIEQKTAGRNPRSTVGTMTEIYDFLRVLYARIATSHCPISGEPVTAQSREKIILSVQALAEGCKILVLAPYAKQKKSAFKEDFKDLLRKGFMRVRIDGDLYDLNDDIELDGSVAHDLDIVIDRLVIRPNANSRIAEALSNALDLGEGVCKIFEQDSGRELLYSMHAFSEASGESYESLEPQDFSFNSPSGMCLRCQGLGRVQEFQIASIIDPDKSIAQDCCSIASSYQTVRYGNIYDNLARLNKFKVDTPWSKLSKNAREIFLHGTKKKWVRMRFVHPIKGNTWTDYVSWKGVLHEAQKRYADAKSDSYRKRMERMMSEQLCPECNGARLRPYPASSLLGGRSLSALTGMTVADCLKFFLDLELLDDDALIAEELLKEIRQRLQFLVDVGLDYLTLDRTSPTLSGGEAQRVRLASQIGCGLVGVTYVLDEPSVGLHPRDNRRLLKTLHQLRDKGNTVIVVEHDEETMWGADYIVDFGPGAGARGGEIVAKGSMADLLKSKRSITAQYLRGDRAILTPKKRRKPAEKMITIKGAKHNNLKNVTASFPTGVFTAVTGVSGSGKSSLVSEILYPACANALHRAELSIGEHKSIEGLDAIDKVISIDQSPIGRNPRSNPATYIKVWDEIRDLFSQLPESRARGYKAGRFSFNVKEGSCPQCSGMGQVKVNMDFMEDAWVDCSLCKTRRYDPETLSVRFKGKSIFDILDMEIERALLFFENVPSINKKLSTLIEVGMGYIKLGQPSTTLSGGEAQRIKLAKELSRPNTGQTLYILDEPTTGLHFEDILHLLRVLQALVDKGNTVLVIEHNMDVVKCADWIIDLGPEGGAFGGKVTARGTPESIAKKKSPSGEALHEALYDDREAKITAAKALQASVPTRKERSKARMTQIQVRGADQHNLKHLDLDIPRGKITVCTGPSGSGKTSLALDTVYAEGQRRYIESLSPYARQFVKQMPKPQVAQVEGLSPAIAIEQKAHAGNPRSTVGTMTEVYDYLRVLFARIGIPHCPETGEPIKAISKEHVAERILAYPPEEKILILAPIAVSRGEPFTDLLARYRRQGFMRIRLNGEIFELDTEIPFKSRRKNQIEVVVDRLKVDPGSANRIFEAIENAEAITGGRLIVQRPDGDVGFNLAFAVESTGKSYPEITPKTFAFNTPDGMCIECQGLGYQYGAHLADDPEVLNTSVIGLVRHLWGDSFAFEGLGLFEKFLKAEGIPMRTLLRSLTPQQLQVLLNGSGNRLYKAEGKRFGWVGINTLLIKLAKHGRSAIRRAIIPALEEITCSSCQGSRLNPLARHVTIEDKRLEELCALPMAGLRSFTEALKLDAQSSTLLDECLTQLDARLKFLCEVGLEYISIDRKAPTLSGGEAQRIKLARQLGSNLTGVLYVLDEPTIGLHPHDNHRLNQALAKLKGLGNTLLLVEHDPMTVQTADYILDFGPKSGVHGGHITARGTLKQIQRSRSSLSGGYLTGRLTIPSRPEERPLGPMDLQIRNASAHNLKSIDVDFPLGNLSCLTGVSGSGKSTLLHQLLVPAMAKTVFGRTEVVLDVGTVKGVGNLTNMIVIDQKPIGQTSRSDVGTYCDLLPRMRKFFTELNDARAKGLQGKHFSANHRSGMCSACWGLGYKRIEMHFLPPVRIKCPDCHGLRLSPRSLEVEYKGKNFGQYMQCTVDEARQTFEPIPPIRIVLDTLISVGLGYVKIGQAMATLSGGEAQRIKLSRELLKRATGKTLYLLDEPTTGLHADDIAKLLEVLQRLVDKGNTMIVIEHNLDFIQRVDYIVDLGPGAGDSGGEVLCTGRPREVATYAGSYTGQFLREAMERT